MANLKSDTDVVDQLKDEVDRAAVRITEVGVALVGSVREAIEAKASMPQNSSDLLMRSVVAQARTIDFEPNPGYEDDSVHREFRDVEFRIGQHHFSMTGRFEDGTVIEKGKYRALFFLVPVEP